MRAGRKSRYTAHASSRVITLAVALVVIPACMGQTLSADLHGPRSGLPTAEEKKGLLSVPRPDLSRADERARRALAESRERLDGLLSQVSADPAALADAFGDTGMLYHAHFILGPAVACYRNAMTLAPNAYRWPYLLGYLYQNDGSQKKAIEAFGRALSLNPGLDTARLRIGQVYREMGNGDAAEPLLLAVTRNPRLRAAALFELGKLAYSRKRPDAAVKWLERTLATDPTATKVHYTLALAYRDLGDDHKARQHLELQGDGLPALSDPLVDALESLSTGQRILFRSAMEAVYQEHYGEAASIFQRGLALDPENLNARISLARVLYLDDRLEAAMTELTRVLDRDPSHEVANFLMGLLYAEQGSPDLAREYFQRVLEHDPAHAGARFYLGNALFQTGHFDEAALQYAESLRLEPDNPYAREREVLALIRAGRPHSVVRDRLESALAQAPDNPRLIYLLTALLAASPEQALRDGARATILARHLYERERSPWNAELLAMAHAETGEFRKALELQDQALEIALAFNRLDMLPRLERNREAFARHQASRDPWPSGVLGFDTGPGSARAAFRGYPTSDPY